MLAIKTVDKVIEAPVSRPVRSAQGACDFESFARLRLRRYRFSGIRSHRRNFFQLILRPEIAFRRQGFKIVSHIQVHRVSQLPTRAQLRRDVGEPAAEAHLHSSFAVAV